MMAGLCLMVAGAAGWLRAHDAHDSVTEAHYNGSTGRLEVTMRVHGADLEAALSRVAGRPVLVKGGPDAGLDKQIFAYVCEVFRVKAADGTAQPLVWVGRELEGEAAGAEIEDQWLLHLEVVLPGGLEGASLRQGVFCELFADQINLVTLHEGVKRVTLGFAPDRGEKLVVFPNEG
jgi:hypothetical protein